MPQEIPTAQGTPNETGITPDNGFFEVSSGASGSLSRKLYGGFLVLLAAGSMMAIGVAYIPVPVEPDASVAAVAAEIVPDPFADVSVIAKAAYVYDITEKKELFAQNADEQLPLASIAKVALALVVDEVLVDDDIVEVSSRALEKGEGGLNWGEAWRMRDLLDYTLVASSNVGAEALAEKADARLREVYTSAPAGEAAVWRMNDLAREIGLDKTEFENVSGLDLDINRAGAFGTARDVAYLFEYATTKSPGLFTGTTRAGLSLAPLNFPKRYANNTNNAIAEIPGIVMGKTGTTDLAGGNLAVAFEAEGHTIVVVVLGATPEGRFGAVTKLVETARGAVMAQ